MELEQECELETRDQAGIEVEGSWSHTEDFGSVASESAIPATTYVHVRGKPPEVQVKGAAAAIFDAVTMRDDSALER